MEDEADRLNNVCADLVSLRRLEPAIVHLFRTKTAGEWATVAELYQVAGITDLYVKPELAVVWLPSAGGDPAEAVILFCDEQLQWSLTAYYNVGRLFRGVLPWITPVAVPGPGR